jgi:hypothetical protein
VAAPRTAQRAFRFSAGCVKKSARLQLRNSFLWGDSMASIDAKRQLAHSLKLRFGLPPGEPTDDQVDAIVAELAMIGRQRRPVEADWRAAVKRHCPGAGPYKYASTDNSDLNWLLSQAGGQGATSAGGQPTGAPASTAAPPKKTR